MPNLTSFSGPVAGLVVQWSPQQSAAGGVVRSNPAMGKFFSPGGQNLPFERVFVGPWQSGLGRRGGLRASHDISVGGGSHHFAQYHHV